MISILLMVPIHMVVCKGDVVGCQFFSVPYINLLQVFSLFCCGGSKKARHERNSVCVYRIHPVMVLMALLS